MKKQLLLSTLAFWLFAIAYSQEYATFTLTGVHQGTGTFVNAALPDFSWMVEGSLTGEIEILDDEIFDDGNAFEAAFGQADNEQNLRIQIIPNGAGTNGLPLTSSATLTLNFGELAPANLWGFCLVDIDVENALISARDQNDNEVPLNLIDSWMLELFDANLLEGFTDIPKWDASNAAILGSDTPEGYIVHNNLVIGGMPSSEAPATYFRPDIPIKSLTVVFENLQDIYATSYHFYIASLGPTGLHELEEDDFSIYPNPCSDKIQITNTKNQINSKLQNSKTKIEIIDLNGKAVHVDEMASWENGAISVDVSRLPAGLYFLKLQTEDAVGVRKIIIK